MIFLIYMCGYIYLSYVIVTLWRKPWPLHFKVLLFTISSVPIGKLAYFDLPFASGFKFNFLLCCLTLLLPCIIILHRGIFHISWSLFPLIFILPPFVSLFSLKDIGYLLYYSIGEQKESALLRFMSVVILSCFSSWIAFSGEKYIQAFHIMAEQFLRGIMFTTLVGLVIFHGVWTGWFPLADLQPITAGYHVIGKFFRFNPGANVNEFGMILGYGIVLLILVRWPMRIKAIYLTVFSIADFMTLTRAAWIGLMIPLFVYLSLNLRRRVFLYFVATTLIILSASIPVFINNDLLFSLLVSRLNFLEGASNADRMEKYHEAITELLGGLSQFCFGFGWSSNLYVHSVPIQMFYETGLVGVLLHIIIWTIFVRIIMKIRDRKERHVSLILIVAIFSMGLFHHNFYHMQTWLVLGLVWAMACSPGNNGAVLVMSSQFLPQRGVLPESEPVNVVERFPNNPQWT